MEYFKVVGDGCRTRDGYQWHPGKWNIEKNGNVTDDVCGVGLHVWKDRPRFDIWPYRPNSTYRVLTVEGLLGEDTEKARFKKVKLEDHPMSLDEILGPEKDGLKGAVLTGADLSYVYLTGANLSGTDLTGANLTGAVLSHANLMDASLSHAIFTDANLTNAHGCKDNEYLSESQRASAHC